MLDLALTAQVIVWLIVLGLYLASGQASLFHPSTVYLGFHALVFVVRPILVYYFQFDAIWHYIGFQPSDAEMIKTLAVTSVALIVLVGTNIIFGWARVIYPEGPAGSFSVLQRRALVVITFLLLPLIAYSIRQSTGGELTGERTANGVYIMTNSTGYVNDAQLMIAPLLCAWLFITRFHWLNLFPVVLYIGYRSWCGWGRFAIISFFIAIVLAYCWYHRKKWVPFLAIVLAIPILMLFNTLGHNRDYFQNILKGQAMEALDIDIGMSQFEKFRARADTQDFANFDYLTFVVAVVPERTEAYTYGTQYLQLFTEPIPRILWKGKPAGAPIGSFNINSYGNFLGLTFSLPGDGWCSGGWIGLVITMGIVGSVLGFFHRRFWLNINNPMVAIFYCTAMAMLMQWYRDGGISISKFIFWNWVPLLMWMGMNWLLGQRLTPVHSVLLPAGASVRIVQPLQGSPLQEPNSVKTPVIYVKS